MSLLRMQRLIEVSASALKIRCRPRCAPCSKCLDDDDAPVCIYIWHDCGLPCSLREADLEPAFNWPLRSHKTPLG